MEEGLEPEAADVLEDGKDGREGVRNAEVIVSVVVGRENGACFGVTGAL